MEKELENIKFKYVFRDYQQEVLEMLEKYISDKKIHIVAAPGAGKTILALELLLRIGNKALILAPTIAIKEQWIERLTKDFENGNKENLISSDLDNPSIITVITYQYLYSLNRKNVNLRKIIQENKIKTIILDEAHHLRKTWQKTLKNIIDDLENTTTISLTATPPYDNGKDFSNYMELCGEIDAKITIPQLVKNNCLCPHQDYIYFNILAEEEEAKVNNYYKYINNEIEKIKNNEDFIKCVALHDLIINPEENTDIILTKFNLYVSMLSFLKEVKCKIPSNKINDSLKIPNFTIQMMEIILQEFLFEKETTEIKIFKETMIQIKRELRDLKCIDEDKHINLKYNKEISELLLKNTGKLDSITEIIKIEQKSLKEKLKLVVITDYIKDEYYYEENEDKIKEIGIIPIFRKIISKCPDVNIAILTGTWVVIPTQYKNKLLEIAQKEYGISEKELKVSELGINFNYARVILESKYDKYMVNIMTKLFEQTDISVLIGTIALIGEGWDAPFVNSLIMASIVSSYVTSNQVRGRTIRIDKNNANKVSNIWHLVCMEKDGKDYKLGYDYEILSKRFLAFEGLNLDKDKIDTGIDRFNLNNERYTKLEIEQINNHMIEKACNRSNTQSSWNKSLKKYIPICTDSIPIKRICRNRTNKVLNKAKGFLDFFTSVIPYEKFIKKICKATYKSFVQEKMIESSSSFFVKNKDGNIVYGLKNANTYEQMIYLRAIKQAIVLDDYTRYMIKIGSYACSVPEKFAKNKQDAIKFLYNVKYIGKKLIYTKSENGRKELLKIKIKNFI